MKPGVSDGGDDLCSMTGVGPVAVLSSYSEILQTNRPLVEIPNMTSNPVCG